MFTNTWSRILMFIQDYLVESGEISGFLELEG